MYTHSHMRARAHEHIHIPMNIHIYIYAYIRNVEQYVPLRQTTYRNSRFSSYELSISWYIHKISVVKKITENLRKLELEVLTLICKKRDDIT